MVSVNDSQNCVQLHALQAGHLTLPERFFVHPSSDNLKTTVPSLSFLIKHTDSKSGNIHRLLFDLGLRHPTTKYPQPVQNHIETRQPLTTYPDVVQSLEHGGMKPNDIDLVIYSHIHWDHIGDPESFPNSTFVVGPGTSSLFANKSLRGGHLFFEENLLPEGRTIELPSVDDKRATKIIQEADTSAVDINFNQSWRPYGRLPRTIDLFQDGSVLLVDAPGHLPGHINILARIQQEKYVYLAGDVCHDRRILTGEKQIADWIDESGHVCCIHVDKTEAQSTIERIRILEAEGVEIIFAHDISWEQDTKNSHRFFGNA